MFSNLKSAWESECHNPIYDGHMSVTDELVKKGWGGKPMGASQRTFLLAGGLVLLKCKESWGQCSHPLIVGILQNSNSVGRKNLMRSGPYFYYCFTIFSKRLCECWKILNASARRPPVLRTMPSASSFNTWELAGVFLGRLLHSLPSDVKVKPK